MKNRRQLQPDETDELLALLADHNRRIVLEYFLDGRGETASVDELVAEVDERGHDGDDKVRVVLHHSTLPKLDEADVVEYDPDRARVEYRGHELIERMLEELDAANRREY